MKNYTSNFKTRYYSTERMTPVSEVAKALMESLRKEREEKERKEKE